MRQVVESGEGGAVRRVQAVPLYVDRARLYLDCMSAASRNPDFHLGLPAESHPIAGGEVRQASVQDE